MAITKRAEAIQAAKALAGTELAEVADQIRAACNRVPESVMKGDAKLAVEWRTKAEESLEYSGRLPDKVTLSDAHARVALAKTTLSYLVAPTA